MKNHKKIFLLDGLGALLSALILGFVLPYFQKYIGMPLDTLYLLMFLAVFFCFYSFNCYWRDVSNPLMCLGLIVLGNSLYCLLTLFYTVYYFQSLTACGVLYFVVDVVVIAGLVAYEWFYLKKWESMIAS